MDNDNDLVRFAKLVKAMRHAQKEYFAKRDEVSLGVARDLERRVDKGVAWIIEPRQGRLLPHDADGHGAYASDLRKPK